MVKSHSKMLMGVKNLASDGHNGPLDFYSLISLVTGRKKLLCFFIRFKEKHYFYQHFLSITEEKCAKSVSNIFTFMSKILKPKIGDKDFIHKLEEWRAVAHLCSCGPPLTLYTFILFFCF